MRAPSTFDPAACGGLPEVAQADGGQLRLQLVQTDAVARGGEHPDDVQHLAQESQVSHMTR